MKAFFIVGVQRSGTTLLSVMLDKHPAVLMEKKSIGFRIITGLKNMYDLLPFNMQHTKKEVLKWLIKKDENGRLASFLDYRNIEKYDTIRDLVESSIEKKLSETEKIIWGDKSPNLQHFANDIMLFLPKAKFIHIVRDGRANAYSMSTRSYKNLSLSAQEWVDGNIYGMVNQEILGKEHYKIIRYEDLLSNPEKVAKEVCIFLDIPFASEMIKLSDEVRDKENSYVKNFFDESKIDKWKQQLSSQKLKKVETIQGPLLKELGYELQTPSVGLNYKQLSLRQRIWYNQKDNIKQLFHRRRIGMKDKEMVKLIIPFKQRAYTFLMVLIRDLMNFTIFKSLFSHFFYKEKLYTKEHSSSLKHSKE